MLRLFGGKGEGKGEGEKGGEKGRGEDQRGRGKGRRRVINRRYRKVHVASLTVGKFAYYVLSFYNSNTVVAFLLV